MNCPINKIRNPLLDLPTDVKDKIISNLHDRYVINTLFLVCNKNWLEVVRDENMWAERAICQLGKERSNVWYQSCGKSWKKVCQTLSKKGLIYSDKHERGIFKNGMLDGKGKRELVSGVKEIGIFKAGQLQSGKIIYPDGSKEEGVFENGKLHGRDGIRIYLDGSKEEGVFENGELKQGRICWGDGEEWEGQFKDGQLDGIGRIFRDTEEELILVEGIFEQGRLVEEYLCQEEYFSSEEDKRWDPFDFE